LIRNRRILRRISRKRSIVYELDWIVKPFVLRDVQLKYITVIDLLLGQLCFTEIQFNQIALI